MAVLKVFPLKNRTIVFYTCCKADSNSRAVLYSFSREFFLSFCLCGLFYFESFVRRFVPHEPHIRRIEDNFKPLCKNIGWLTVPVNCQRWLLSSILYLAIYVPKYLIVNRLVVNSLPSQFISTREWIVMCPMQFAAVMACRLQSISLSVAHLTK